MQICKNLATKYIFSAENKERARKYGAGNDALSTYIDDIIVDIAAFVIAGSEACVDPFASAASDILPAELINEYHPIVCACHACYTAQYDNG